MNDISKLFNHAGTFVVDETNSDDERFYVDVRGLGTVVIESYDEGMMVDIFPLAVVDKPVSSIWVRRDELTQGE